MVLDLKDSWDDLCATNNLENQGSAEVGDTDALCKLLLNQSLHSSPGSGDWSLDWLDISVLAAVCPSWWVTDLWVNISESDWEVNIVKIEVVNAEVCKLLAGDWLDALVFGESTPKLGDDEEILTLYEALLDGSCETLSGLLLVTVIWEEYVSQ